MIQEHKEEGRTVKCLIRYNKKHDRKGGEGEQVVKGEWQASKETRRMRRKTEWKRMSKQ